MDDEQTVGVYSYGMRLMFETHVPRTGGLSAVGTATSADTPADPEPPRPSLPDGTPLTSPDLLDPANYFTVAGRYGAAVEPPPSLGTIGMAGSPGVQSEHSPTHATPAFLFYRSYDRLQVLTAIGENASGVIYASAWKSDVYIAVGASSFRDPSDERGDAARVHGQPRG